ncbi:hypothetical protein XENOCAPTIV_012003, partial [Xenoophorus captivus]
NSSPRSLQGSTQTLSPACLFGDVCASGCVRNGSSPVRRRRSTGVRLSTEEKQVSTLPGWMENILLCQELRGKERGSHLFTPTVLLL